MSQLAEIRYSTVDYTGLHRRRAGPKLEGLLWLRRTLAVSTEGLPRLRIGRHWYLRVHWKSRIWMDFGTLYIVLIVSIAVAS